MSDSDRKGLEEPPRKRLKTSDDGNRDEPHNYSDTRPKISEISTSEEAGGAGDNDAASSDSKQNASSSDPGSPTDEERKQDLKSIVDEFSQLKEKFFADKIAAVKTEIEQVENGTHEEVIAETLQVEQKMTKRIQLAKLMYDHQVASLKRLLDADIKCCEDEFDADKKEVKEKTLKNLQKRRKELEEEKRDFSINVDAGTGEHTRVSTRTLRKRGQGKEPAGEIPTSAPPMFEGQPKKIPDIRVRLNEEEMDADMALIQQRISTITTL